MTALYWLKTIQLITKGPEPRYGGKGEGRKPQIGLLITKVGGGGGGGGEVLTFNRGWCVYTHDECSILWILLGWQEKTTKTYKTMNKQKHFV